MVAANEAYYLCPQAGLTPLAVGMPGVGKTSAYYAFAKAMGRKSYTLIASLRDPADVGGYPYPGEIVLPGGMVETEQGRKRMVMKLIPPQWAADCHDGQRWIIFMDELTTCAPAVQSALLRVLAEHVVGDLELPPDTWIMAACNPPEQAANGIELEAAMANRLAHLKWETPRNAILQGWQNNLNFPEPQFTKVPDDWQKHIAGVGGIVAAFHTRHAGRLEQFPTDRSLQSGPWPSPRTWTYAIRAMAAAQAVQADKSVEFTLLSSLVGEPAATEFSKWREALDLPDPEQLLAAAMEAASNGTEMAYQHPDRPDKVMAMLASVSQAVISNNNPQRWEAGMAILEQAARFDLDVALASSGPLARAMRDSKGGKFPQKFLTDLYPRIQRALDGLK